MAFRANSMALVLGAALVTGCAGIREHRGYVMDQELVSGVQVGVDNKESVERTLGRPSFTGTFDQNDWYYVSRDTAQLAFRLPRVTDQTVLHVRFDAAGNVAEVRRTDEQQIAAIRPNGDQTPTLGRERGFFEELFNNVGTISQPGLPGAGRDN
jgi:outer membrane protein assembly factor BamE (lipoprotein component of BamABCDE complex)